MQADLQALVHAAAVLWRRRFLIVTVAVLSGAAAWLISSYSPRDYRSEKTLLYRFGREYFPVSPGEQRRNWGENVIISLDAAIFTEVRLLSSHTLLEKTIDRLGLETIQTKPPAPTLLGFVRNLGGLLQKSGNETSSSYPPEVVQAQAVQAAASAFSIQRVEGSALVSVSAVHPMPDVADRLVKEHVETYLAWRRNLFDRNATEFFTTELDRAREELAALVAQRKRLMRQYEVVDVETELRVAQVWLGENERALVADPSNARLQAAAEKSRKEVTQISELRSAIVPLDERIKAAATNIASLEQERASWALTRTYSATVAPTVSIIDDRTAWNNPVGLSSKVKIAIATIMGGMIASLAILMTALISSLLGRPPLNERQQFPKTTRAEGGLIASLLPALLRTPLPNRAPAMSEDHSRAQKPGCATSETMQKTDGQDRASRKSRNAFAVDDKARDDFRKVGGQSRTSPEVI